MKRILTLSAAALVGLAAMADGYVYLNKNDVNLRSEPSTTADVVKKGKLGSVMRMLDSQQGWYKVVSPEIGETPVWVSNTVASKASEYCGDEPASNFVSFGPGILQYSHMLRKGNSESVDTWEVYFDDADALNNKKDGSELKATLTCMTADTSGRARSWETTYAGTYHPYYVVLTKSSNDGGESWNDLEESIFIYPFVDGQSNIYVNGVVFEDMAGGMDDEW